MERKDADPSAAAPDLPEEPLSGRGRDHNAWTPAEGDQGLENRVIEEDPEAEAETDPSKD